VNATTTTIQSDIQAERTGGDTDLFEALDAVGMSKIQLSLQSSGSEQNQHLVPATADLFVSLRQGRRGIHMSRLYELMLTTLNRQDVSKISFGDVLNSMIESQQGDSDRAEIKLNWNEVLDVHSLKSNRVGVRVYPVQIQCVRLRESAGAAFRNFMNVQVEVIYSSTCPQSLALSQELSRTIKSSESFAYVATPHAQRSKMNVALQFDLDQAPHPLQTMTLKEIVSLIEASLKTPVQTIVKKADEMEFARLNAENPLFCEDASRRVAQDLRKQKNVFKFSALKIEARHEESLHPHDAVSRLQSSSFIQF